MRRHRRLLALGATLQCLGAGFAQARSQDGLADPLRIEDVLSYAQQHRREITAARARAHAAAERPAIVSALEDPMVMPSVDHLPFMLHGLDASLMVEQQFPLSGVLGHRKRAAEEEARRLRAQVDIVTQGVLHDAVRAFLMLRERRETARILAAQVTLAHEFVSAANGRYSSGTGSQPEVLRAEVELARLEGSARSIAAEITAAEAMFNASLGRPVDSAVPRLAASPVDDMPPSWNEARTASLRDRPELQAGRAEIGRARAEISTMDSMYSPMALVRTGPAYTMSDGWGWMLTLGISVPIWSAKYEAGVREAQAMAAMANADVAAMTRMIEGEAAASLHQVRAARQRVLSLRDDVLPRARAAIEPSVAAYAAGAMPLVSVMEVAQTLWSLEAELIFAEYELGLARARLARALGKF